MESRRGARADEPAQAAVKDVRSPVPRRAESAGQQARFQNLGLDAVHLQIATAREPGHTGTDDDDFFLCGS